jgi:hypothetical protein
MAEKKKNAPKVRQPSAGDYLNTLGDVLFVNPRNSAAATLGGAAYDYAAKSTPRSVVRDITESAEDAGDWLRKEGKLIRAAPIAESLRLLKAGFIDPLADPYRVFKQAATERARGNTTGGKKLAAMVPLAVAGVLPQGRGASKLAVREGVEAATKKATKSATKKATPSVKVTPKAKTPSAALPAQSPFAITGKADMGQEVLRLKAKEMEITDPKKRTQPTGTEPVFDLSQAAYEETPSLLPQTDPAVVQAALPRAEAGATYPLNDRMRNVMDLTPRIAERLAEKAQQGRGTAQEYFYHTAPVVRGLEEVGVPRSEAIQFLSEKFAPAFAGTSPRTNTEQNMRNASLMMYLREKGVPISGELYDTFGNARGYNMMGSHQDLTGQMFAGTHDPMTNPKPSAFLPNVAGDLGYVTADTHNIRGALLAMNEVEPGSINPSWFRTPAARERYAETAQFDPATDINDSLQSAVSGGRKMQVEYGPMADVTFEAARQAGIAPGPMQSLGWFGSGGDTGLASATKTVAELMDERINVTAQALGMHPKVVLQLYKEGKIPLMAKGGSVDIQKLAEKYAD